MQVCPPYVCQCSINVKFDLLFVATYFQINEKICIMLKVQQCRSCKLHENVKGNFVTNIFRAVQYSKCKHPLNICQCFNFGSLSLKDLIVQIGIQNIILTENLHREIEKGRRSCTTRLSTLILTFNKQKLPTHRTPTSGSDCLSTWDPLKLPADR